MTKDILRNFMYGTFSSDSIFFLELKKRLKDEIKNINIIDKDFETILYICYQMGNKPFIIQKKILELIDKKLGVNISTKKLIELNIQIQKNELCQNLIVNYGIGSKYWKNTIIPISQSGSIQNTIEKKPIHPYRIGLYPGLSCMFECVFCGRNYNAKYDRNFLDAGIDKYINLINESPKDDKFKFYISGGLEPLTNPKLSTLIKVLKKNGFEVPLYTNGQMFTEKYLNKSDFIKDLYSIRISLYGTDEDQYEKTVRKKNQFKLIKNNIANLIRFKNKNNLKTSIGLNYIILDGRSGDMLKLLDFVKDINDLVGNKKNNIDFITLREDFRSTTNLRIKHDERLELVKIIKKFQKRVNNESCFEGIFVDYGYSLEPIKNGLVDHVYEDVFADEKILLKEGTPNISVAIDLYGDVYCYREAAFLDRPGAKRYILGRVDDNTKLENIIEKAIMNKRDIVQNKSDLDYLDAFDHIVLRTLDQAKRDKQFGVPFNLGPVKGRIFDQNEKTVNFQTHFSYPIN